MDIRTKLALALVSVALLSMSVLGAFAYRLSSGLLQEISERQLDALAETKQQDLAGLLESWRDEVRLIRSRTQLRIRLRDLQRDGDTSARADIARIVADAQRSTQRVRRITVFDRAGAPVAMAGTAAATAAASGENAADQPQYAGLRTGADGPEVVFRSPVSLEGQIIGSVEVVIGAQNLAALAGNYRGLGETGETLIFARQPDDELLWLHPLRHDGVPPTWSEAPPYVRAALEPQPQLFTRDQFDYRDQPVWAATRLVPGVDWGLVVKIDAREENARALSLRENLIDLALALGAFAVVGGTLLGFYLARPIRELANVVERVRHGETWVRAKVGSEDEIGLLAETINAYLDHVAPRDGIAPADDRDT